jgi:dUTP pyrophosphatase
LFIFHFFCPIFGSDSDYRGEVAVLLINGGHEDFAVTAGDRVAQLILEKCSTLPVVQVEDIGDSTRGEAGFGSTGVTSSGSR